MFSGRLGVITSIGAALGISWRVLQCSSGLQHFHVRLWSHAGACSRHLCGCCRESQQLQARRSGLGSWLVLLFLSRDTTRGGAGVLQSPILSIPGSPCAAEACHLSATIAGFTAVDQPGGHSDLRSHACLQLHWCPTFTARASPLLSGLATGEAACYHVRLLSPHGCAVAWSLAECRQKKHIRFPLIASEEAQAQMFYMHLQWLVHSWQGHPKL